MSARIPKNFWSLARSYSATVHGPSATAGDHSGGSRLWKLLSIFVAVPGVGVCFINAQLKEKEEHEHFHRPEFKPYSHLHLRTKKFPFGDGNHTLFHNKKVNALPEGYED